MDSTDLLNKLRSEPGLDTLLKAVEPIFKAKPEALRDTASKWSQTADACDEHFADTDKAVAILDNSWTGKAADAFTSYMGTYTTAGKSLASSLRDTAAGLAQAADILDSFCAATANICNEVLAQAALLKASSNESQKIEDQIRTMANNYRDGELRNAISDANGAYLGLKPGTLTWLSIKIAETVSQKPPIEGQLDPELNSNIPQTSVDFFPHDPDDDFKPDWEARPQLGGSTSTQSAVPLGTPIPHVGVVAGGPHVPAPVHTAGAIPVVAPAGVNKIEAPASKKQLNTWVNEALQDLEKAHVDVSKVKPEKILEIIDLESSGRVNVVNDHVPDQRVGLMQATTSLFDKYSLPGHNDIHNPVDNVIAGVRRVLDKYPDGTSNIPGLEAGDNRPYVGLFAPSTEPGVIFSPLRHHEEQLVLIPDRSRQPSLRV